MAPPERTSDCSLLLIYRPRKDERLSWPSWLTCSGRSTHIGGHPSDAGRARKWKVRRPKTDVLPLCYCLFCTPLMYGLAPLFVRWMPASSTGHLSSSTFTRVIVEFIETRLGDRSFAVAGPAMWNMQPTSSRSVNSYTCYKYLSKAHLFAGEAACTDILIVDAVYKFSYLLTVCVSSRRWP